MANSDPGGFGKFVPGFDFLQNLARQAGGGAAPGGAAGVPPLGQWVAPTFSVEELDKRIEELKAVQFWLDQNARALAATIQALEVQKMTLATLQGMNVSLGDVAQALNAKAAEALSSFSAFGARSPAQAPSSPSASPAAPSPDAAGAGASHAGAEGAATSPAAPTPFAGLEIPPRRGTSGGGASGTVASDTVAPTAPEAAGAASQTPSTAPTGTQSPTGEPAPAGAAMPGLDPMGWWGALSQQFQTIASQALKDAAHQAAAFQAPAAD